MVTDHGDPIYPKLIKELSGPPARSHLTTDNPRLEVPTYLLTSFPAGLEKGVVWDGQTRVLQLVTYLEGPQDQG